MIGVVIAVAGVVVLLVTYSWWSSASVKTAERETADARVAAKDLEGKLAVMTSDRDAHKARANYQEKRANALDTELDAVADSGDPLAARGRVLSRLAATEATATNGSGAGAVSASGPNPGVARVDDTALERPGP